MAKKEKAKKPEAAAAGEPPAEGAEGAPVKKKLAGKTLVLFVILPAVLVLGGGGAAAMMLLGGGAPAAAAAAEPTEEGAHVAAEDEHAAAPAGDHGGAEGGDHAAAEGDHGAGAGGTAEDATAVGQSLPCEAGNPCYYAMPKLVMNLASTGGARAVMMELELSLESSSPSSFSKVPELMPRLKDTLNSFLRELRVEDLNGSGGTYTLRRELLKRFNTVLDPKKIDAVLIEGMLIQ